MQLEVRRLQQRIRLTTLFITHDQEEALIMSDRIAVMRDGEVKQVGSPEDIYARPRNAFVADFVGESNLIIGRIARIEQDRACVVDARGREITACIEPDFSEGEEICILLRPEMPQLVDSQLRPDNELRGRIVEMIYLGNSIKYRMETSDGLDLLVRWPVSSRSRGLAIGDAITVGWRASDGHVLRRS
jgi:ABC-type Fe3+/spermidine/putrescine transport system ATPase subunit